MVAAAVVVVVCCDAMAAGRPPVALEPCVQYVRIHDGIVLRCEDFELTLAGVVSVGDAVGDQILGVTTFQLEHALRIHCDVLWLLVGSVAMLSE